VILPVALIGSLNTQRPFPQSPQKIDKQRKYCQSCPQKEPTTADANPTLIQVDGGGWDKASVESFPFFRTPDLAPSPDPDTDWDFNKLLRFLPFNDETDKIIFQIYAAMVPFIEYERPILVIFGPHSSGKSNVTRILRDIIDPQNGPVGDMPYDRKDLIINLSEACLPAFDNANEIIPRQCQAVFSG
jgi:hypothetical protein